MAYRKASSALNSQLNQSAPIHSDMSELSELSSSPNYQSFFDVDFNLKNNASSKQSSPDPSDVSDVSILSRSPSPPPESGTIFSHHVKTVAPTSQKAVVRLRGQNGRFVSSKRPMLEPSSRNAGPVKKKKTVPQSSEGGTLVTTQPSLHVTTNIGFGSMSILPTEIRQIIFGYAMEVECPVIVKRCCGPEATKRGRDACPKHGKKQSQNVGRFTLLLVSKAIKDEAGWVLFNQGSLILALDSSTWAYFANYHPRTSHRLGDIPHAVKVKNMWMAAARYRFLTIAIPTAVLKYENPEVYTARLRETAALLLKGWEQEPAQPTSQVPHTVTIELGSLFNEIVPFNADPEPDKYGEIYLWLLINFQGQVPNYRKIAADSGHNLKMLLSTIALNRGRSEWKFAALSEIGKKKGGAKWLRAFEAGCRKAGLSFEGRTRKQSRYE